PAPRHAEPEADRMCFLAHRLLFLLRLPAALGRRLLSTTRRTPPGRRPPGGGRAPFARRRRARTSRCRRRHRDGAIPLVADANREMARAVLDRERTAHRARLHALE